MFENLSMTFTFTSTVSTVSFKIKVVSLWESGEHIQGFLVLCMKSKHEAVCVLFPWSITVYEVAAGVVSWCCANRTPSCHTASGNFNCNFSFSLVIQDFWCLLKWTEAASQLQKKSPNSEIRAVLRSYLARACSLSLPLQLNMGVHIALPKSQLEQHTVGQLKSEKYLWIAFITCDDKSHSSNSVSTDYHYILYLDSGTGILLARKAPVSTLTSSAVL